MKKWLVIVCVSILCSGCAITMTDFASLGIDSATPTDILLTTGDLDRPYNEIGVIFVKGKCARYKSIVEKLRAKAKENGADAVIKIEFGNSFSRVYRPFCRGVAITFKEKESGV